MELPKYHETFLPILETLNSAGTLKSRELAIMVRDKYYSHFPETLLKQKTRSGKNVLLDRILWAKSYLKMAKLVSYPKRGFVQITEKGKQVLKKGSLSLHELQNDQDFINYRESIKTDKEYNFEHEKVNIEYASPQDLIDSGFSSIEKK